MPKLVSSSRRLCAASRRLVTDKDGAPCVCGGCFDEFPTPPCIVLTLELIESVECVPGSSDPVELGSPPPGGAFQVQRATTGPGPQTYLDETTEGFPVSVSFCGNEPFAQLDFQSINVGIRCRPDAWDGGTRFGIAIPGDGPGFSSAVVAWSGGGGTINWLNGCGPRVWTHEQRPGATVLMEGETALTPPVPASPACSDPEAQYRVSWVRSICEDQPPLGACCYVDGTCSDLTADDCLASGGAYKGDGTTCVGRNCPTDDDTGACCLPDGRCLGGGTRAECSAVGGKFTPSVGCAKVACIPYEPREGESACCLPSGFCAHLTPAFCSLRGGTIIGAQCQSLFCSPDTPQLGTAGDFF